MYQYSIYMYICGVLHFIILFIYLFSFFCYCFRWSFATFGGSLFTVFKIFAGEWYISFSDCVRTSKTPLLCFIVIIPFYVVGYLVILNVFTAVLLSAFDASSLQHPEHKKIEVGKVCI